MGKEKRNSSQQIMTGFLRVKKKYNMFFENEEEKKIQYVLFD